MVVFEWWILKVVVIVVGLLRMIVLIGGSWFYCFSDLWFWFHCNLSAFSTSVSAFFLYFFRSFFHSTSTCIYSGNVVAMRLCECACKNFKFHQLSEAVVCETWTYCQFFKVSLLKLYLFAPKGYTIALQSEEKNGCVFNALKKKSDCKLSLKIFWLNKILQYM
jgi:hypothetical protein